MTGGAATRFGWLNILYAILFFRRRLRGLLFWQRNEE